MVADGFNLGFITADDLEKIKSPHLESLHMRVHKINVRTKYSSGTDVQAAKEYRFYEGQPMIVTADGKGLISSIADLDAYVNAQAVLFGKLAKSLENISSHVDFCLDRYGPSVFVLPTLLRKV